MAKAGDLVKDFDIVKVQVSKLAPNDYNPKKPFKEDGDNMERYLEVLESIRNNWYWQKIQVRELDSWRYEIVDWYHRFCAMMELWVWEQEIQVINFGKISRADAIALNTAMDVIKVPVDSLMQAQLYRDMKRNWELTDEIIAKMPYSIEQIDAKIELLEFNVDTLVVEKNNDKDEEEETLKSIVVFVATEEEVTDLTKQLKDLWYENFKVNW